MSRRASDRARRREARKLERRIDAEAAELEVVRIAHYAGAHLIRRGGDFTFCGRPARQPAPAHQRFDKLCKPCSKAAQALTTS